MSPILHFNQPVSLGGLCLFEMYRMIVIFIYTGIINYDIKVV